MSRQVANWQEEIASRLEIQPTVTAMQRHLLFALRSASVLSSEPVAGEFRTIVEREEQSWTGTGPSAAEAMGRALLAMTPPGDNAGDASRT